MSRYTDAEKAESIARARATLERLDAMQPHEPAAEDTIEAAPWPRWESGPNRNDELIRHGIPLADPNGLAAWREQAEELERARQEEREREASAERERREQEEQRIMREQQAIEPELVEVMGECFAIERKKIRRELRAELATELAGTKTEIAELRGQIGVLLTLMSGTKADVVALPRKRPSDAA